jgi:Zn-dependent protease with chaperone function
MTIDEVVEVPKVGFSKIIQDFTSVFHYETWAWIIVLLAFSFLVAFLGYYFSNTTLLKRTFFTTMLLVLLALIISLFSGFFELNLYQKSKPAIVFSDTVSVKSEPKSNATDAFILHAGTKVFVIDSLNNYKKIQLLDLKEGWIEKVAMRELK